MLSIKLSELCWVHSNNVGCLDEVCLSWLNWDSLSNNLLSFLLGSDLEGIVGLYSLDESKSGLGFSNVFNSDTDSLWDNSSIVELVNNDTDGVSGNIVNSSGFTMVELVWHTLVD